MKFLTEQSTSYQEPGRHNLRIFFMAITLIIEVKGIHHNFIMMLYEMIMPVKNIYRKS